VAESSGTSDSAHTCRLGSGPRVSFGERLVDSGREVCIGLHHQTTPAVHGRRENSGYGWVDFGAIWMQFIINNNIS